MTMRPICLVQREVQAILAKRMTVVAREVRPQPQDFVQTTPDRHALKHAAPYIDAYCSERKTEENPRGMSDVWCWWTRDDRQAGDVARCPFGVPGDRAWVRERWQPKFNPSMGECDDCWSFTVKYAAGGADFTTDEVDGDWHDSRQEGWRFSGSMPRWASRIVLAVRTIRMVRLLDLTEEDALAQGFEARVGQDFWSCFCEATHDTFDMTVEPDEKYRRERGITHVRHHPGARLPARDELMRRWGGDRRARPSLNPWVWLVGFEVEQLRGDDWSFPEGVDDMPSGVAEERSDG